MDLQNNLNAVCKYFLQILVLTSLVAFAASSPEDSSISISMALEDSLGQVVDKQVHAALPYCGDKLDHNIGRRLLYVTTLDGRVSALDINKSGNLQWSVSTAPGPLISSSIHRLELTNNGRFVRMIPSLSGGIYKFDGESINPIPITTDNLLSSSAKFSDDLVISGGKETRTYGVSARTGQTLYECSMNGCVNLSPNTTTASVMASEKREDNREKKEGLKKVVYLREHDPDLDDVIIVRRQTQTVRAIETRTGIERWNFSVGHHELDLISPPECHDRKSNYENINEDNVEIRVIVPEGIICALNKSDPSVMLWKYKFDHPIVSVWKFTPDEQLLPIDLFTSAQLTWYRSENGNNIYPSIYLGMYEKQLYIQESLNLRKVIGERSNVSEFRLPKIPWRPIVAGRNDLIAFQEYNDEKHILVGDLNTAERNLVQGHELIPYDEVNFALTARSVLNASEYMNGNGFYLYVEDESLSTDDLCQEPALKSQENSDNTTPHNGAIVDEYPFHLDDIEVPVKVVIMSLWFWWKEVVIIAISTAALLNFFLIRRNRGEREIVVIERHIPVPTGIEATESLDGALLGPTNSYGVNTKNSTSNDKRSLSESTTNSGELFCSRFQTDFEMMRCLGRGGFGVVFEAKNKLDDCRYAIKRITLPTKEESRKRVMREVKTLANCEHPNIVRYFQSWVEKPPPGWQEEEDRKWLSGEMSTSIQVETPSVETQPRNSLFKVDKEQQVSLWMESVTSTAYNSEAQNISKYNEEEEDSFIEFLSESQSAAKYAKEDYEHRKELNKSSATVIMDVHSDSCDVNFTNNKVENGTSQSQLSDSFQIEFIRVSEEHQRQEERISGPRIGLRSHHLSLDISNTNPKTNEDEYVIRIDREVPRTMCSDNKVYLYIQMQLCRKESLRHWLRDNTTAQRADYIASIFHQIVDAVDYVHFKGLIHRDLKPSNIFFSQDGQIKIGDFGLVKDMADNLVMQVSGDDKTARPSSTRHTQQVGTHLYMSPEQLRGLPYDYTVDIYSLGVIFFELLVYFSTEMERITTLRSLRDGIYPRDFSTEHPEEHCLLKNMLSEKPHERPSTQDLKLKLSEILKLTDLCAGDNEAAALAAAARRLSRSRTFSSCD